MEQGVQTGDANTKRGALTVSTLLFVSFFGIWQYKYLPEIIYQTGALSTLPFLLLGL